MDPGMEGGGASGGGRGGGRTDEEAPPPPSTTKSKKKKGNAATPCLKDCANCGAPEGTVPGCPVHKPCSKCKCTYYCSVRCQKQHWKVGGHKKRCVALADRSVAKAEAGAEVATRANGRQAVAAAEETGGGLASKRRDGDGEECAICLEDLDDPEFGPAQILDCTHRFHRACVKELRERGVQQACPMCRAKLPDSAAKMFADGATIFFPIRRRFLQSGLTWDPLSRRQQRQMDEVVRLWEGAAEQGLADAQFNLGVMYHQGQGVDVDYKKAIEWFENAAEQGHADAQRNLGFIYDQGQGVDVDYKKAIEWYEKAAEQGHAYAQYNLGIMYERGLCVDQSDSIAMRWYGKAAAQSHKGAQEQINKILTKRRALRAKSDASGGRDGGSAD
jgi:TPR repeat protein